MFKNTAEGLEKSSFQIETSIMTGLVLGAIRSDALEKGGSSEMGQLVHLKRRKKVKEKQEKWGSNDVRQHQRDWSQLEPLRPRIKKWEKPKNNSMLAGRNPAAVDTLAGKNKKGAHTASNINMT